MASMLTNGDRVLTSGREAELAHEAVAALRGPSGVLGIENADGHVELPPELGRILQHVLDVMSTGGTVTVSAIPDELTTTTAASILSMSRPTLMKLIRDGEIPSHRVQTHHRLKSSDVFAFLKARRARERAAFERLRELDDTDA